MKRLILCLTLYGCVAKADDPEKMLDALRSELRSSVKNAQEPGLDPERRRYSLAESMLAQVSAATILNEEHLSQTIQTLEQVRAASASDKVSEICVALIKELRERSESHDKALKEKIDTTLRSALTSGLNAKTAKDLDEPILQLTRLQKEVQILSYRSEGRKGFNAEAVAPVEQLLTSIQDAMLATSNPQLKRGRDVVQNLQSTASNCSRQIGDLIPRSEFLEKMQALVERVYPDLPKKALTQPEFELQLKTMLLSVKRLDDIDMVLSKIDAIISQQRELNSYVNDSSLTSQLRYYRQIYDNLRAGVTTSMSFASSSSYSQGMETLNPIKELLVKFGLTRVLGTSGDLAPTEEENVATYLGRMLEVSRKTSNWQLMYHVLDVAQTMNITTISNATDMLAMKQLLAGMNLERARQFSNATAAYLSALKSGSQVLPAEAIGDMLEKLKKDHPQEYEMGLTLPMIPSNYVDGVLRTSSSSRPMTYPPGVNSAAQQPPTNTLIIPAVKNEVPNDGKGKSEEPKPPVSEPGKNEKKPG